jgi:hypothetical protein
MELTESNCEGLVVVTVLLLLPLLLLLLPMEAPKMVFGEGEDGGVRESSIIPCTPPRSPFFGVVVELVFPLLAMTNFQGFKL